jgi:hypothetical protein
MFLRGMGAAVALPFLESMAPAMTPWHSRCKVTSAFRCGVSAQRLRHG